MRKILIRIAFVFLALIVALAAWLALQWLPPRPKLVVSRETTWITEPLLPDGTVDYEAAWRAEHSAGVTPENNAAPLLLAMLGADLAQFSEAERAALPNDIPRFVDFDRWKYDHEKSSPTEPHAEHIGPDEALGALESGKVDSAGARLVGLWLDAISACLPQIERAVTLDHFFVPGEFRELAATWQLFEIYRALRGSAAVSFASGDAAAGFDHLRSGLRLARLQRSLGIHVHLFAAEDGEAWMWTSALRSARREGRVSAAVARDLIRAADPTDTDARLLICITSERIRLLGALAVARSMSESKPSLFGELFARTDPNRTTRCWNEWMDRIEAACCTGSWSERFERVGRIQQQLVEASVAAESPWTLLSRDAVGDAGVDVIAKIISRESFEVMVPSTLGSERALIELAALAYATETGHDPKTSDDLTPLLFASSWRDRVTHSTVDFERAPDGTLVAHGPLTELQERFEQWQKEPVSTRAR